MMLLKPNVTWMASSTEIEYWQATELLPKSPLQRLKIKRRPSLSKELAAISEIPEEEAVAEGS